MCDPDTWPKASGSTQSCRVIFSTVGANTTTHPRNPRLLNPKSHATQLHANPGNDSSLLRQIALVEKIRKPRNLKHLYRCIPNSQGAAYDLRSNPYTPASELTLSAMSEGSRRGEEAYGAVWSLVEGCRRDAERATDGNRQHRQSQQRAL